MKKKISLLGLILILVFSFSGCGKSDDTVEYDQEQLEQYADFIVQYDGRGGFSELFRYV